MIIEYTFTSVHGGPPVTVMDGQTITVVAPANCVLACSRNAFTTFEVVEHNAPIIHSGGMADYRIICNVLPNGPSATTITIT